VAEDAPSAVAETPVAAVAPDRRVDAPGPGRLPTLHHAIARLVGDGGAAQADGVLTPDHVLEMQRTAGNRATTRFLGRAMLMREDKPPPRQVSADDPAASDHKFGFTPFTPNVTGTVVAKPEGADKVDVTGPNIAAKATVWKEGTEPMPGGSGYVGFVQNLISSDRGKVYRAGGEPAGEVVAEVHGMVGKAWDAYKDRKNPDKPYTFHKPFYNEAKPISDTNLKNSFEVSTDMHDEPGFWAEKKINQDGKIGFLTEVVGQDKFKLALAVETGDKNIVYLQGLEWTLPWAAKVGKDGRGTGGTLITKDIARDKLKAEGPDPNLTNWSLDEKEEIWQAFSTIEQARAQSVAVLLTWLPKARVHDKTSETNIIAALKEKDPVVTVKITCTDEADEIRGDHASASMKGTQLGASKGGIHISEDESSTMTAKLADLYGSIDSIPAAAPLTVEISVGAEMATGSANWTSPFAGEKEIKAGGASYKVTVSV
jgi:hypothetical protein